MATPILKELRYRTFDDLMNEVYSDLPTLTREGLVEPGQLIKIAQRVNNEIGLSIYSTKEAILDIDHGRAKLPSDFHILNMALLCGRYTAHEPGLFNGLHTENVAVPIPNSGPNITTCPCWTVISSGTQTNVVYCDGTSASVFFPANPDGTPSTTQICAKSVTNINSATPSPGCFCWQVVTFGGWYDFQVNYCDGTSKVLRVFPSDGPIKVCANIKPSVVDFEPVPSSGESVLQIGLGCFINPDGSYGCTAPTSPVFLTAVTNSFCYNDPNSGGYTCNVPQKACCVPTEQPDTCGLINPDPWKQNKVFTTCDNTMQVKVIEYCSTETREYNHFEKLYMVPSKEASSFCVNAGFRDAPFEGSIRDGHLFVSEPRHHHHHEVSDHCSKLYICYLGALEDSDGNLLVLDHPKINEFYEWAIKSRIFENMYLNGEPDIENRLKLAKSELKTARAEALSIVTMPNFYDLKRTIETNRRAMNAKYLHPFSSLYGNTPGWPWSINQDII